MTRPSGPDDSGAVFAALSDPNRRTVLRIIADGQGVTQTGIAATMPISRQAVGRHLSLLEHAGLISSTRAGREVHYVLTPQPMRDAAGWMAEVGAGWDERLDALRQHLSGDMRVPRSND